MPLIAIEGYQGDLILLQATCKRFYEYCSQAGIALAKRNFTLRYNTNVPRQVGRPQLLCTAPFHSPLRHS